MINEFHSFLSSLDSDILLENLQGGIVYSDYDPPFYLRYATEGLAHMSGYTQAELLTMQQMDIVWPADVESLSADVAQQLGAGNFFDVEYRLKRKDGSFIHVLDRGKVVLHNNGKKYIHCLLTDITDLKNMERALRLSEEKYKLAIQHSGNVVLDYDLGTQAARFSENFFDVFGYDLPDNPLSADWISPEHHADLDLFFHSVLETKQSRSIEFLIRTTNDTFLWAALTLSPVVLADDTIATLVGCLQNIDKHKREVAALIELSQNDGLTGVYNRVTMESMIAQLLEDATRHHSYALIIVDIDFFKEVNDQFGHSAGDQILTELVHVVSAQLPTDALFGRLGGDEFVIFSPVINTAELCQLCDNIVVAVRSAFVKDKCPVTVSLGAIIRDKSQNFHELYRNADIALYQSKKKGRNGYTVLNF